MHPTDGEIDDKDGLPEDEVAVPERERFHRIFGEKLVPEILRRGIESGLDSFMRSDRGVRKALNDLKLKHEVTNYFFHQIEETKNAALRIVAREVRDFLENTNMEQALRSLLTSLAFEIRTEVKFVPLQDGSIRPRIRSEARPSARAAKNPGSKQGKARTVRRRPKEGS